MKFRKEDFKKRGFIYTLVALAFLFAAGTSIYFLNEKYDFFHINKKETDGSKTDSHTKPKPDHDPDKQNNTDIEHNEEGENSEHEEIDKLDINQIFPENINISKYKQYLKYDYENSSIKISEAAKSSLLKHILTYLKISPDKFGFLFEDPSPQKFLLKVFVKKKGINYFKVYVIELK